MELAPKKTHRPMEQKRGSRNKSILIWEISLYGKGGQNIQRGKDNLSSKWYWENWTATGKRIILDYFLKHCI